MYSIYVALRESGDGIELSFVQRSRSLAVPHHTLNHRSWWLVTASSAPSVPSVPVSMISVSITLRAKEPQVCQVPMCHRNPVASSQSASLIQKLHSTSHPRCSIHVVMYLRYSKMTYACHLCRTFRCSLLNAAGLWSPATLVKRDQSRGTSQRSWNPGSFSHEIMTKTLDIPGYTIKSHQITIIHLSRLETLETTLKLQQLQVLLRFCWGCWGCWGFSVYSQNWAKASNHHGTTMNPQDRKKSRFQISKKYLIVSCCFMQCTSSASIFPRRRRFRHMKSQVSYGFMAYGDHMWPACDILRLSTETYNQRLQRCRAVESGWLQALHLLKRMKAMPPFDLNMSHFHPFPIHPNPRPELSWSFAKQMLLSRLFSRLLTSAHRFYWTYLNVIEHDWTIGLHMPGPSSSRRRLLQHCANCLRRRGRIRNSHRYWESRPRRYRVTHVVMLHWENMNILKTKVFFEHFKWCKAIGSTPSKC